MGETSFGALRSNGELVPTRMPVSYRNNANGTLADESFFVADRAYTVVSISEAHAVASTGAAFVQVTKDAATDAPGGGTNLLTNGSGSGFDLTAAANTAQVGALVATAGVCDLAAGQRLSVDFSATTAPLAGVVLTAMLVPK